MFNFLKKVKIFMYMPLNQSFCFALRKFKKVNKENVEFKKGKLYKLLLIEAKNKDTLIKHFRSRKGPNLFFDKTDKKDVCSIIKNKFPSSSSITIKEADDSCNHIFNLLGSGRVNLGNPINWHSDFKNKTWKNDYYEDLNSLLFKNNFDNKDYIGDIKFPWELNKHLHFVSLGKSYQLTGDEKYAKEFISQISSWIEENPYKEGVAWMQNLIVAQRIISWIFAMELFIDSRHMTSDIYEKIFESLYQHACFISEHFEFTPRSSNHLFGNAAGLFLFSFMFPEFKQSKKWLLWSLKIINSELENQVYDDGVQYEKSTNYHRYVIEFCLLPLMLSRRNNVKLLSSKSETIVEKMIEYIMFMTQPDGRIQPISDADGARVWNLGNYNINDCRSCLSIGSLIFKRSDFKFVSENHSEDLIWFFGKAGLEKYKEIQSIVPKETSKAFNKGGYVVSRNGWNKNSAWLFFDQGNIGMGDWPDNLNVGLHGHIDLLNLGIYANNSSIITDIGSYTYTGSKKWHDYFRGSKGHNLVVVDNEDQAVLTNFWSSVKRPRPKNKKFRFSDDIDYFSCGHDGYKRLKDPVLHKREVTFYKKKKQIVIKDIIKTKGEHSIDIYFHLGPGVEIIKKEKMPDSIAVFTNKNVIISCFHKDIRETITKGDESIPLGWYAKDYGVKVPINVIVFSSKICHTSTFKSVIQIN